MHHTRHHPHHSRATWILGALAMLSGSLLVIASLVRHHDLAVAAIVLTAVFFTLFHLSWKTIYAETVILNLLYTGGWWTGLELIKASAGALSRGTIYVHLQRLEDRGYIRSRLQTRHERSAEIPTGLPDPDLYLQRRLYAIPNTNRPPCAAGKDTP